MTEPADDKSPSTLRWAIWLIGAQAVAVAVLTGIVVYEDLTATATSTEGGWFLSVYAGGLAALLGALSWALSRRKAWARGPAIVLELMLLPIGYFMIKGGVPWFGVPVLLLGLFTAGLLLTPATRIALGVGPR